MRNKTALMLAVASSLILALLLELIPLHPELNPWRPPWLLVVVVFWVLHLPGSVGIGTAWSAGLVMDVVNGAPLGSHALVFTLAGVLTLAARRLLLAFSVLQQALWVAALGLMQYGILSLLLPSTAISGLVSTMLTAALLWTLLQLLFYRRIQGRFQIE